jgi:RNA polymerase sigma-70 factor (ECF subfamily)
MELNEFKTVVLPIRKTLYNYALRLLNDVEETEDTVQEVLLKLWMMRNKLDEYQSIDALSMQITKNICLNKLSYKKRHQTEMIVEYQESLRTESIENYLEKSDMVVTVKQIIETLSPLQKMIIKMRDVEDYELSHIADITGCTIEAVRMNLSRARKKVKEEFFKINNMGSL